MKNKRWAPAYLKLMRDMARRYFGLVDFADPRALERDAVRTLGLLFLARVDGKSPAEYIVKEEDKSLIRQVSAALVRDRVASCGEAADLFSARLGRVQEDA